MLLYLERREIPDDFREGMLIGEGDDLGMNSPSLELLEVDREHGRPAGNSGATSMTDGSGGRGLLTDSARESMLFFSAGIFGVGGMSSKIPARAGETIEKATLPLWSPRGLMVPSALKLDIDDRGLYEDDAPSSAVSSDEPELDDFGSGDASAAFSSRPSGNFGANDHVENGRRGLGISITEIGETIESRVVGVP